MAYTPTKTNTSYFLKLKPSGNCPLTIHLINSLLSTARLVFLDFKVKLRGQDGFLYRLADFFLEFDENKSAHFYSMQIRITLWISWPEHFCLKCFSPKNTWLNSQRGDIFLSRGRGSLALLELIM